MSQPWMRRAGDAPAAWIKLPSGSQPAVVSINVAPGDHLDAELRAALEHLVRTLQKESAPDLHEGATCTKVGEEPCAWHAYCTICRIG